MKLTGENPSTERKTCSGATLSTTNLTRTNMGSNPGLRGERPATNHLSNGKVFNECYQKMHTNISGVPEYEIKYLECDRLVSFVVLSQEVRYKVESKIKNP
jgi:hypothetical protein